MAVKYYLRAVLGLLIASASLATTLLGFYFLARGGSCASGGVYVSNHECDPTSTAWAFGLPPLIIAGVCGMLLFAWRGQRPGTVPDQSPGTLPGTLPGPGTVPGAGATPFDRAEFLRGLAGKPGVVFLTTSAAGSPASAEDPLVRLERLQALLAAGALSQSEFERTKAKLLSEL